MQVVVKESYYDVPKHAMSAEIENNKEDETTNKEQPKKPLYKRLLQYWQIGFKLTELLFCGLCLGLIYEPAQITGLGKTHLHHVALIYATYAGYALIISVTILTRVLQDRQPFKTSLIYSIIASILFAVAGIIILTDKSQLTRHTLFHPNLYLMEMLIATAALSLINAVIFLIDGILTYRMCADF